MKKAPIPDNEADRLSCLISLNILDTLPEERFDRITRMAQEHFKVPFALISLVDSVRQWFKSKQGIDASETPRDISFCGHAILSPEVLYVPNALEDERFADNPLVVGPPFIRFYAGVPLSGPEQHKLGTLCIIDRQPRTLSAADLSFLKNLASCVERELFQIPMERITRELRVQTDQLHAILDSIEDGIIGINAIGIVQSFNRAAEKMFGYTAEEILGQNVHMLMPEPDKNAHDGYIARYLQSQKPHIIGSTRVMIAKHKNGHTFSMALLVRAIGEGENTMFIGTVRDISGIQEANLEDIVNGFKAGASDYIFKMKKLLDAQEEELVKASKLGALGEMVGTFAHEISTPIGSGLVASSFCIEILKSFQDTFENGSLKKSELQNFLQQFDESIRIINSNLIRSSALLQSFKRLAVDQCSDESYEFNLKSLLDEVVLSLRAKLKKTPHQILLDCPENCMVFSYPGALSQIFTNFITNSLMHGFDDKPQKGTIRIEIKPSKDQITFVYTDDGKGIPPENLERIFQRHFTTRRGTGGSGLGLHIVQQLVTKTLRGTISVQSKLGEGTQFTVVIPINLTNKQTT